MTMQPQLDLQVEEVVAMAVVDVEDVEDVAGDVAGDVAVEGADMSSYDLLLSG